MLEFKTDLQNVKVILKGGNCPPKDLLKNIREMEKTYPNDMDLQNKIKDILNQLGTCEY